MTVARNIPALIALVERRTPRRFRWGEDCVRFAARAVMAQAGVDPLAGLRWRSRRQAVVLLDAEGGLLAAVDRRLTRIAPALAARGDIAAVHDDAFGVRLMVVEGATLIAPGTRGLERQPRHLAIHAWDAMSAVRP